MKEYIKVTVKNEDGTTKVCNVKSGTKVKEILDSNNLLMGVRVNNEIRTLNHQMVDDAVIQAVSYYDYDGYRIYTRTCKYILAMALKRCFADVEVEICNSIDNASYFLTNQTFSDDMICTLYDEMKKIVSNGSDCVRKILTNEEVHALYSSKDDGKKIEEMNTNLNSYTTMYFCEDIFDTMHGVLADNTSKIINFKLIKFRKGFALIYPNSKDITKCEKRAKESNLHAIYEENNDKLKIFGVRSVYELNQSIIDGKIKEVIDISETAHENKLQDLVDEIVKRKKVKLILIAGPSSSGKTTFASKVALRLKLAGYNTFQMGMDNYFKEREDTPKQPNGEYDFETVDALDLELLNAQMAQLLNGEEVELPEFNFIDGKKEYKGNKVRLEKDDVIIMEGIHAFNEQVSRAIPQSQKYKIYIAPMTTLNVDDFSKVSTTDTRMLRRMVRDFYTRGNDVEKTLRLWSNIMAGEEKYIFPYVNEADGIFNTSLVYEISALKQKAEPLLLKVPAKSLYFSEARRLYRFLSDFLTIDTAMVPGDSILREFIGK